MSDKPAEHTPVPWQIETETDGNVLVVDVQGVTVARCYQQPYDTWSAEASANLIAAAPDLLAACENLVANLKSGEDELELTMETFSGERVPANLDAMEAAIAKAKGVNLDDD